MTPDAAPTGSRSGDSGDVVTAVDEIDGRSHVVVADIARDDAWIAVTETDAASLERWR
jgi:hypothetical protein